VDESLNLAQLWRVPVVFVCENNHWAESTPQSQHQPIEDVDESLVFALAGTDPAPDAALKYLYAP